MRSLAYLALASLAIMVAMAGAASAAPVLERVVLVARHGVRAPTASPQVLQEQTGRAWPPWPVSPGDLTPHGSEALGRMAAFVGEVYQAEGLLPKGTCPTPGLVQVWSDSADRRTRESGSVWSKALNCGLAARSLPEGRKDPLFDAVGGGVCAIDPKAAFTDLAAQTRDFADLVRPREQEALVAMQTILAPDACRGGAGPCLQGPTRLVTGEQGPKLDGPLAVCSSLSENLLLEYVEGFRLKDVGWGRMGGGEAEVERALDAVLPAHVRAASLLRQTPYLASRKGAVLARTVLDLLQGRAPSDGHAPPLSAAARLTVISGHDTNLSNLAGVFGLSWILPDEPDVTAPDTTLAFEVWRVGDEETVRAVVYSQSLQQLRTAAALDLAHPAGVTSASFAGCLDGPQGACRLATLAAAVALRLPHDCLP
jgi:4-phytase/acid phosphatase